MKPISLNSGAIHFGLAEREEKLCVAKPMATVVKFERALDTLFDRSLYCPPAMIRWPTTFVLILALAASTAVGVHADAHEGSCPMANMPDCCKKAHSPGNTPEVSMARLCCNLNCSEPGSSGTNSSSSFSAQQGIASTDAVMSQPAPFSGIALLGGHSKTPHRQGSNPKYIQHLALLI